MEQFNLWQYIGNIVFFWLLLWLLAIDWHFMKTGNWKWRGFEFNKANYYLLTLPFLLAAILISVQLKSYLPILVFLVFCAAGVVGEAMFSFWWNLLFEKRFWVYRVDTAWNGYTSFLNFLPWGLGGLLFLGVVNVFSNLKSEISLNTKVMTIIIFFTALVMSLTIAYFLQKRRVFRFELREFNGWTYLLFCLPILAMIGYVTIWKDGIFGFIAVGFGISAFIEEYLFGKMTEVIISKKLWYYNFFTIDNEHTTVLNIIPFMLAGFYFWGIYIVLERLV